MKPEEQTSPGLKKILQKWTRELLLLDNSLLVVAAILGFLAGLASTVFRWMIDFVDLIFSQESLIDLGVSPAFIPYLTPLIPMFGGGLIGLICYYFPSAVKENGVHKVMEAVALNNGKIHSHTIASAAVDRKSVV